MPHREFKRRRQQLMKMMEPGSIAILPAAVHAIRNRDAHYPYRQDSDFYYLTGFPEPEAVAVLIPGRKSAEYILFCREKDPERELWDGLRVGQGGACKEYGADDSFPMTDLDEILPRMLEEPRRIYYAMGCNLDLDRRLADWISHLRLKSRSGIRGPLEFIALDHYLHEMRLYKSKAELDCMRKAVEISVQAHLRAMRSCRPGLWEYQLEAEFLHECAMLGATRQAYTPIVGGGANACILHYNENRDLLKDGDLVLIDAGCEYQCFASDITRTYPVNGRFSDPQRTLYELVLEAQQAAIAQIKPGNHWNDPHDAAVRVITKGLKSLGLLKGSSVPQLIRKETYKRFYMHRSGHWLGMDVHDVGDYKIDGEWRLLEPGMTLTVEPGLYVPAHAKQAPPEFWNIGIRIEDDVMVIKGGHEVLSAALPRSVAEVETVMAG